MSPELRFVAACCRWPGDDFQREQLDELAPLVGDWDGVIGLAGAHRVEGLVWRAVDRHGVRLPEVAAAKLEAMSDTVHDASVAAIGETLRICGRLDAAGIEHRIFKGLPLALTVYGSPAIKNSIDIDLLVRPANAVGAASILSGLGYVCAYPPGGLGDRTFQSLSPVAKEACFVSARGQVDLHWALVDQPALLGANDPWTDPRQVELLPGHAVVTLPDPVNLAYLAAHGAASGWSRLKWLADFAAFLSMRPEAERERLCGLARGSTGGRMVDQGLILVERLFGPGLVPAPAGEDRRSAERLAKIALNIIEARRPGAILENGWRNRLAISRCRGMLLGGVPFRLKEVARAIRRQEVHMRLRWPLPRKLHWLYMFGGPIGLLGGLAAFARRRS